MPQLPHYVAETQMLRRVVRDPQCRFIWTKHAELKLAMNGWNAADVVEALTNGHIVLQEQKRDRLWRVEGRDIDGNRIQVVVAVYETAIEIKVVTTF